MTQKSPTLILVLWDSLFKFTAPKTCGQRFFLPKKRDADMAFWLMWVGFGNSEFFGQNTSNREKSHLTTCH